MLDLKDPQVWTLLDELSSSILFKNMPTSQVYGFLDSLVAMIPALEQRLGRTLDPLNRADLHLLMDFAHDNTDAVTAAVAQSQKQAAETGMKVTASVKAEDINWAAATYAQIEAFVKVYNDKLTDRAAIHLTGAAREKVLSERDQRLRTYTNLIFNQFYTPKQVEQILSVQADYIDFIEQLLGKEITSLDLNDPTFVEFSYWALFVAFAGGQFANGESIPLVKDKQKLQLHIRNMTALKGVLIGQGLYTEADFTPSANNREAYQTLNYLAGLLTFGEYGHMPDINRLLTAVPRLLAPGEKLTSKNVGATLESAAILLSAEDLLRQNRVPEDGQATAMLEAEIQGMGPLIQKLREIWGVQGNKLAYVVAYEVNQVFLTSKKIEEAREAVERLQKQIEDLRKNRPTGFQRQIDELQSQLSEFRRLGATREIPRRVSANAGAGSYPGNCRA